MTRLTQAIKDQYMDLLCSLSPENLSCDGELSSVETAARYQALMTQWANLDRALGMRITSNMVEAWFSKA